MTQHPHQDARPSHFRGDDSQPLLRSCIGEVLDASAAAAPEAPAVISRHQGLRVSYGQLQRDSELLARGLLALGVEKGDRLALWAANGAEWLLVQYAAARIGAILVTLNPAYGASELELILRKAECQTLVMSARFRDSDHVATLTALCPELESDRPGMLASPPFPMLRNVILIGEERHGGMFSWDELFALAEQIPAERLSAVSRSLSCHDPINIQFTSGTTGSPKGVVLSHHNIINNALFTGQAMGFTAEDRICLPVPFFHCFGMVLGSMAAVLRGAAMVLPGEQFDAGKVLEAIDEERCTAVYGVPTMFIRELEHPAFAGTDTRSLRTGNIGGAPCPPPLVQRIAQEMRCPEITIGYGLTEASPIITLTTMTDPTEKRMTSVGRPLPHTEVRIVDPQGGQTLPCGEKGELCVRGYGVMQGYYKDEEATRTVIDGHGWLHTGDLATMDEDGYCSIVGRIKDVIIRGGEKIYPREIEELLLSHAGVSEAHVIGVPDAEYGETVGAWVKPEPGSTLSAEELALFCKGRIASYKIPRRIRIVSELPTTVTGKVQKYRLREMEAEARLVSS
jgi:fatty-acyl-CoA synthase